MGLFERVRCITMSYKWETDKEYKYYLQGTMSDRRRRLTEEHRKEILDDTEHSYRELARMYGVTKNTIMYLKRPEAHLQNLKRRRERGGSKIYYNREVHNKAMRNYRKHKQELFVLKLLNCLPDEYLKENKDG